ncbi:hypothetical protein TNCV_744851 [Trichonephila clavipes]|nr:hypothetical protein TNCV_744851 [Trichonephila clavipes]
MGRNENAGVLDRLEFYAIEGKNHLYSPLQFRYGTGGEINILQPSASVVSATTTHKTLGPTDLTNTYSVCTWKIFVALGHRTQPFRCGIRCSNY